jgi:Uma2 family endonuclease
MDPADHKHELWDGEVYAMGGKSLVHNQIVRNLVRHIGNALDGSSCEVLPSDMRVRVPGGDRYVYPDVTIVCGEIELDGEGDVLLNPSVIFEVLSPSTAAFDRGEKFAGYRSIVGLNEVVFVSQRARNVECYSRQDDGSWVLREACDDGGVVLRALAAPLPLSRIYDGVGPLI